MTFDPGRRLLSWIEAGNRRIDFRRPAMRGAVATLALAAVAAIGGAAWLAWVDVRGSEPSLVEAREAYVRTVQEKIQYATNATAVPPGRTGKLRARLVVNRQGRLIALDIVDSSGVPELDALVVRVVRESAPFERFPEPVRRTTRRIEILSTFEFK